MTIEKSTTDQHNLKVKIVDQIASLLKDIRFGSVEIVIHDGKIVQIERKEKLRFESK